MKETVRDDNQSKSETTRDAQPHAVQRQNQTEIDEVRLERIKAVMIEAVAKVDPTESALGVVTSDLLELEFRMKKLIDEAFSDTANAIDKLQRMMPMIQMFMKVTGQITRYVEVQRLLGKPGYRCSPNGVQVSRNQALAEETST